MFTSGVRATLTSSRLAAPLMVERGRGLIVYTVAWIGGAHLGHLSYDLPKAAIMRMAFAMAHELRPYGVAAVALAPCFMRTERVMAAHAAYPFPLDRTESPEYLAAPQPQPQPQPL
jgi:NAD(P)-dependent dehydrogenase (short-subunit alcohol dehydrogenase family)